MIPRVRFLNLPTPIEAMPRLSASLGGPRLWVKRDDLVGLAFGGNKARKLEIVLAEAQAHGAKTLITVGAAQSNHCRLTAAAAARFGLKCILVLSGDPSTAATGNLVLDHLFGAEIVWCKSAEREQVLQKTFETAWDAGLRPLLIPLGASTPSASLAYTFAFDEFLAQNIAMDWIVVASSSGGTQAGLALGALRAGWKGKILGISIDHPQLELQERVAGLASQAAELLGEKIRVEAGQIMVNAGYLGAGYGVMSDDEREAIRMFARLEGLLIDPVYTGRAAAAMIDLARAKYFKSGENVLFWQTGGTPALFADPYTGSLLHG